MYLSFYNIDCFLFVAVRVNVKKIQASKGMKNGQTTLFQTWGYFEKQKDQKQGNIYPNVYERFCSVKFCFYVIFLIFFRYR